MPTAEPPELPTLQRILIRHEGRMVVVPVERIDWIESADNYALIHEGRNTHILRETLTRLELRLAQSSFLRISRQALVNLACVREIQQEAGTHHMVLACGAKLPITRGIREVLAHVEAD